MTGRTAEVVASFHPQPDEMEAYERVLGDAMVGDATLFARQDYVEEAWRIVDPILEKSTPVYGYEPATWGPDEVAERVAPKDGWHNPTMATEGSLPGAVRAA
jgi:glucose-6-phosphate 1-dehydrogenase